jgi:glycosyltransferase involved in cell wall biosynthesis
MDRCLRSFRPDFVCVSHGAIACGLEFMESCLEHGFPYVSVSNANSESFWPSDPLAVRLERTYHGAARAFFVSASNLRLFECQTGATLPNAEIVFNPYNVPYDCRIDWPTEDSLTRLACVGRLDPSAKGQDLLLRLLSRLPWSRLPLRVSFFGSGPMAATLKKLATSLGVDQKVGFCGHVADVAGIWRTHHALVLPSRYEGLPLAVVEAMLSGRPVITTDVAGNTDFITDNQTGFVASAPTLERLGDAMTRAWNHRNEWPFIGAAAAAAIRQRIPSDPPFVFAQRLLQLASGGNLSG